ncbi:MAG: preprotein translocase subunit SecG [Vampirovibrionales bacterium]|nr:preprotein translocase subunit SecG [Vampirovibrionales bacterium]
MEVFKLILQIAQNVAAFLMIVLVLLHSPKGDGIGAIGGTAQIFSSAKGANATLVRITAWVSGAFFFLSFILGYYLKG